MWGIFIYMDITSFSVDCFKTKNSSLKFRTPSQIFY